jgi:hypothetical protein
MKTPRGGNGDEQPPGGGGPFDGLSGMPPEWGPVVIPDDASSLDDEAQVVRKEFRRDARRYRWRRRLRLSAPRNREAPSLGVPLAIMAIAVVATLISLFAVAWPGNYQGGPNGDGLTTRARPLTLPDLTLLDSDGVPVRIRDAAPAVVLLVDGCSCDGVIANLVLAVDPRVGVLVVTTPDPNASASAGPPGTGAGTGTSPSAGTGTAPSAAASSGPSAGATGSPSSTAPVGVRVRHLLDPAGALRASVPGLPIPLPGPAAHGTLLLVSSDWAVVRVVSTTMPMAELKADLARLAG